jgi:ankyrin repeat protein
MFVRLETANSRGSTGDYPLHKIAIWGDVAVAEVLLDYGADINARGEDDDTPLHRAIAGRHVEMIRFLLSRGADPEQCGMHGGSSRRAAMWSGDQEIISATETSGNHFWSRDRSRFSRR